MQKFLLIYAWGVSLLQTTWNDEMGDWHAAAYNHFEVTIYSIDIEDLQLYNLKHRM